jgi:AcrR family transcriptional regulator
VAEIVARRPKRADALRNHDALLDAARDAFSSEGIEVSLEEVARRAGVGIGTLYRNFPSRAELLEAVYLHEVEALCAAAEELQDGDPWESLLAWIGRFVEYTATKRAVLQELAGGSPLFQGAIGAIVGAGGPLLERAQEAGEARTDVDISDVLRLISSIALAGDDDPEQRDRIVAIAVDGLRTRP